MYVMQVMKAGMFTKQFKKSSFAKYVDMIMTGGDSKQGSRECIIYVWASYG